MAVPTLTLSRPDPILKLCSFCGHGIPTTWLSVGDADTCMYDPWNNVSQPGCHEDSYRTPQTSPRSSRLDRSQRSTVRHFHSVCLLGWSESISPFICSHLRTAHCRPFQRCFVLPPPSTQRRVLRRPHYPGIISRQARFARGDGPCA